MILHFSHIGFTDARTFIALEFVSEKESRRPQELGRGQQKSASWPTGKDSKARLATASAILPQGRSRGTETVCWKVGRFWNGCGSMLRPEATIELLRSKQAGCGSLSQSP